jgi:methylated-DNA-[protein]-cysteine S-methyltransferase
MTRQDENPEPLVPPRPADDPQALAAALERFATVTAPGSPDDVDVAYATTETPVGEVVLALTDRGLVRIAYTDFADGIDGVLERLARRVSPRVVRAPARLDPVRRELEEYFAGSRTHFDVPLDWQLVDGFGRRILEATAAIPFGETSTYGAVAAAVGVPGGARAAGNALGANPLPIVVPCHRILAAGGRLGGYTGGTERKEALLAVEGVLPARLT